MSILQLRFTHRESAMAYTTIVVALLVLTGTFWAVHTLVAGSRRTKHFPPGPPTLPILGNSHQIPTSKGFLK